MKKRWKAWAFLLLIGLTTQGVAQTNTFPSSGNVGIGTTSPLAHTSNLGLHIDKGAHSTLLLGDPVGLGFGGIIQTTDSKHRVFIGANIYDDQNNSWGSFDNGKGSAGISFIADNENWGTQITFIASSDDGHYNKRMVIKGNGNVGIGTFNPDSKLSINGTAKAEEVIVEENVGADFVFEEGYDLPHLQELEAFIQQNKHLPQIPSAEEMKRNGVKVGELQMKLLQKIEELTLHIIEQRKQLKSQKEKVGQLEAENEVMQEQIKEIFLQLKNENQ